MVQYCRKCGAEIDDDSKFCEKCGFSVDDDPTKEKTEPKVNTITDNKNSEIDDKNKFIKRSPLIVSAIAIIMALFEGLGTPMLMGWTSINGYWGGCRRRPYWNIINGEIKRTSNCCS